MTLEHDGLPARPFFNCSPDGLSIVDGAQGSNLLRADSVQTWMEFKKGENNVIETTPRKLASRDGDLVAVECEGCTVHIDFADGMARKVTPDGEYVYMGGLDERNDGKGYIPIS